MSFTTIISKKKYNKEIHLFYVDTDSLYLHVKNEDILRDLKEKFAHIIDTSNFPPNHVLYSIKNKNKLGLLKFESTDPVVEFVGLKAKQNALSYGWYRCKKTAKGIQMLLKHIILILIKVPC